MPPTLLSNTNGFQKTGSHNGYQGIPIAETIHNGFFTVDRRWTVKYWNKAAEDLLGVPARDLVGKNVWDRFAGILPLDFYRAYHKAGLQNIPAYFKEYWGELGAWFEVITYYDGEDLSVSFKSCAHDANPLQLEQRLRVMNDLYRFVTEITNDCLWEWNFQTSEQFWIDGGHKRAFGYPIENALIPQSFWESCIHPDDKGRVLTRLHKVAAEGSSSVWEDEYRFAKAGGGYAYVHDRGHIIYDGNNNASRMIGATQDISARKLAEIKLVEQRLLSRQEMTAAVLSAQQKARSDIGMELHDNLNQILGASKLYIEMARTDDENREQYLDKSSTYIVKVIEEIRKISRILTTPGMVIGLFDSIRILLDDLNLMHAVKIEFHAVDLDETGLDEKIQLDLFRIVQEQVNNILRHANATGAAIHLTRLNHEIILRISDNGEGYDTAMGKRGMGMINIRSRAEWYHGRVEIVSAPGQGYELTVVLPLHNEFDHILPGNV